MVSSTSVTAIVTGDFLAPPGHRVEGQRVVAVAYLVRHPDALVLFDTGFPFDQPFSVSDGDIEIRTWPRPVDADLRRLGTSFAELDLVANCHLHVDHAGGNHRLPRTTPIYVQRRELESVRDATDTVVRDALRLDELAYRPIDGEVEIVPGLTLVPTPGHTDGHQSLVVESPDGPILLGGQSMPTASDFGLAMYARMVAVEGTELEARIPDWLSRIEELAPIRAVFAHDLATWHRTGPVGA